MGSITFLLPNDLSEPIRRELELGYVAGGPDGMPWPTKIRFHDQQMTVQWAAEESGFLAVPWQFADVGHVMLSTATLARRPEPYTLLVELARGKVNQVRCLAADLQAGGFAVSTELLQDMRTLGSELAHLIGVADQPLEAEPLAERILAQAVRQAHEVAQTYARELLQLRQKRQGRLDARLGCRLKGHPPTPEQTEWFRQTFHTVRLPLTWAEVEPMAGEYLWEASDTLLGWAKTNGLTVVGGPLIDFSVAGLPVWLKKWERDFQSLASYMCDFVATVIDRYRNDIRTWQLTAAGNTGDVMALNEERRHWLTAQILQTAAATDKESAYSIGIAQPWGEYLARAEQSYSPLLFVDLLLRGGLPISAVDVEIIMGVQPRGSLRRDLLDISRVLDLYTILGTPIRVTLACPSSIGDDPLAKHLYTLADNEPVGWSPTLQGKWAGDVSHLILSKPYVQGLDWLHFSDAEPHSMPHCGVVDAEGKAKPALAEMKRLREMYLA